jgi:hypothetical protein
MKTIKAGPILGVVNRLWATWVIATTEKVTEHRARRCNTKPITAKTTSNSGVA